MKSTTQQDILIQHSIVLLDNRIRSELLNHKLNNTTEQSNRPKLSENKVDNTTEQSNRPKRSEHKVNNTTEQSNRPKLSEQYNRTADLAGTDRL